MASMTAFQGPPPQFVTSTIEDPVLPSTTDQKLESLAKSPNMLAGILSESGNPTALVLHYAFRSMAVLVYLLSAFISSSFVVVFVATVVLLAADFWVVKNVTGRILVGRRWWSRTGADGSAMWSFEARPEGEYCPNATDRKMFWMALYGFTGIWTFLGIVAVLRFNFSWLVVVGLALTMQITNLMGYLKCDREAQHGPEGGLSSTLGSSLLSGYLKSKVFSLFQ